MVPAFSQTLLGRSQIIGCIGKIYLQSSFTAKSIFEKITFREIITEEKMHIDEMDKDQLIRGITSIVATNPVANTAGALIKEKLDEIIDSMHLGESDAIEKLAELGSGYGERGELGGINVYCDNAARFTRLTFTNASESTQVTTHLNLATLILVHGYENNPPMRFEPDWWIIDDGSDKSETPHLFGDE
jgi:hypothetical protein